MKKLKAKYVSASESGDYFQVIFEETHDSLNNYFLIQKGFEFDDYEKPDDCYIESDDRIFCGHMRFKKAEISRERFYLQLAEKDKEDLEIYFKISERNFREVKRVLKIILSGCNLVIID